MELIWLYVAILAVSALAALILYRLVHDASAKERIGGWATLLIGICFLTIFWFNADRDWFGMIVGLACVVAGIVALRTARWNEQLHRTW